MQEATASGDPELVQLVAARGSPDSPETPTGAGPAGQTEVQHQDRGDPGAAAETEGCS